MSYVRHGEDIKLRVNHRGGADGFRQTDAVRVIDRIPADVLVTAFITQPTVLPQTDAGQVAGADATGPTRYVFEQGARTFPRNALGIQAPGAGRGKVLVAGPSAAAFGAFGQLQVEPAWAAIATPGAVSGALVPYGREEKTLVLPIDGDFGVPDSQAPAGLLLRIRLAGENTQAATAQAALSGGETTYSGQLNEAATRRYNIAPGTVVFVFSDINGVAVTARDRGDGQIVGQAAAPDLESVRGLINYVTGEFEFTFSDAAGAHAPTAAFEYDTLYNPLDVRLEWDPMMAHG